MTSDSMSNMSSVEIHIAIISKSEYVDGWPRFGVILFGFCLRTGEEGSVRMWHDLVEFAVVGIWVDP